MDYLIIMPAYNVASKIPEILKELKPYHENVLLIDDGSTDGTYNIITKAGFKVIKNNNNLGVSKSIIKGLNYASKHQYNKIILMDADGQHQPKYLDSIIANLNTFDFVFCSRFGTNRIIPTVKWNSNIFAAMIINNIWHTNFLDISCGFKAFTLTDDIISMLSNSSGYQLVFDIFFYALQSSCKIKTIEVDAIYDNSDFLSTRRNELLAFFSSLKRADINNYYNYKLDHIHHKIINKKDFTYKIENINFYGFYLKDKKTYILQSDIEFLWKYVLEVEKNRNE